MLYRVIVHLLHGANLLIAVTHSSAPVTYRA